MEPVQCSSLVRQHDVLKHSGQEDVRTDLQTSSPRPDTTGALHVMKGDHAANECHAKRSSTFDASSSSWKLLQQLVGSILVK